MLYVKIVGLRIFFVAILGALPLVSLFSQQPNIILVRELLSDIKSLQVADSGFYYPGTFPCQRSYGIDGKNVEDNNVFFTGLIAFTLHQLRPYITDSVSLELLSDIREKALFSFGYFQNTKQKPIYNFWPTQPPVMFPGAKMINMLKGNSPLSDDIDDTSILYLAMDENDSAKYAIVVALMDSSANGKQKIIKNTFKKYKNIQAYSTWFGRKMPKDFDFCVLTNVLYFLSYYHLPIGKHGEASIELLGKMLAEKEYVLHPAYISPHYGRTPILIYHYARLIQRFPIGELTAYKVDVVAEAKAQLEIAKDPMDRLLLHTSLIWLGDSSTINMGYNREIVESNKFSFFVAGIYSYFNNPFRLVFGKILKQYQFKCEAYNKALLLENIVYSESINKN